jgi:hypothetical protein
MLNFPALVERFAGWRAGYGFIATLAVFLVWIGWNICP